MLIQKEHFGSKEVDHDLLKSLSALPCRSLLAFDGSCRLLLSGTSSTLDVYMNMCICISLCMYEYMLCVYLCTHKYLHVRM